MLRPDTLTLSTPSGVLYLPTGVAAAFFIVPALVTDDLAAGMGALGLGLAWVP